MTISVKDWELLSIFEAEPHLLDPDVPWIYTQSLYRHEAGGMVLLFEITPSYKDVHLTLQVEGVTIYEYSAFEVRDVCYRREEDGREVLVIDIEEGDELVFSVKPTPRIRHETNPIL